MAKRNNYREVEEYNGYLITEKTDCGYGDGAKFSVRPAGTPNNVSNRAWQCLYSVEWAKRTIDDIVAGKIAYISEKEYDDKVSRINVRHGWGATDKMLKDMLRRYKAGDLKERTLIADRLEDMNYHRYVAALDRQDYAEYERLIAER